MLQRLLNWVFYLATLNLLRAEQYKWENRIVIGVVPPLDREPKDLNEFLEPAVYELKALWKGVHLKSSLRRFALMFHAAVMCVSSNVPATQEICGFKSHSAVFGCSCCLKQFPGGFWEKGIIPDLIKTCGGPILIKTIFHKLSKLLSAKQKPSEICWVKEAVSGTIASYFTLTTSTL